VIRAMVRLTIIIRPVVLILLLLKKKVSIRINITSIEPFKTRVGIPDISRRPKINTYANNSLRRFRYLFVVKKPKITARNIRMIRMYRYISLR
jgi:hypothetical protein